VNVIEAELLRIWDERGQLSAPIVVQEAAPAASPLHAQFEWDDSVAGEKYRLRQAGDLIRSHKVTITRVRAEGTVEDHHIRQWMPERLAVPESGTPGNYVPVDTVTAPGQVVLLQKMQRDIQSLRRRYEHLQEFWDEIGQLQQGQAS
jgi:hypothetical protein